MQTTKLVEAQMEQTGGVGTVGADDEWSTDRGGMLPDSIKVRCIPTQATKFERTESETHL